MSLTRDLAAEVIETQPGDVPLKVMAAVKAMTVDHIGISFMGRRCTGEPLASFAKATTGPGESLLLGDGILVDAGLAAGINTQTAHNSGLENTGPGLHPGPVIVHTAFAAAQKASRAGAGILAAMAVGYELNTRFHLSRTADEDVRHLNCIAAAVASKVLGHDIETTAQAMSIAWEIPMRTLRYLKPKVPKRISPFPMGGFFAAQAGFMAAALAASGLDTFPDEIDHLGDEYDLDKLADRSEAYQFVNDGLFLKKWPSSNLCHMVLQAVTDIVKREDLAPDDITSIRVGLPNLYMIPHQNDPAPESYWQGIYSAPWGVSMAAHRVKPGPEWFTPERFADPSCRRLAAAVTIVEHPPASDAVNAKDFLAVEGWVDIETAKGRFEETKSMRDTAGSPTTPLTDDELREKFLTLTSPDLGTSRAETAFEALNALDACDNISECADTLRPR